ncbi:MAG: protein kinase, partial [Candidatus Woesearchaeota archaeon]|nr:protein kinase [Candidatus Woesearchaeota archaeon]
MKNTAFCMRINLPKPVDLIRRIYRSGTATTYFGSDNTGSVAVKVFDKSADAQLMAGLEERACNAIRAVHSSPRNIVLAEHHKISVREKNNVINERTIAVSPYINGVTVSEIIDKRYFFSRMFEESVDALSIGFALKIGIDACDALAILHDNIYSVNGTLTAMVHSDLGPKNLIVGCDGKTRVIDFGACLPMNITSKDQEDSCCNLSYCSPEQASLSPYDVRADQFTLGMTLYALITGKHAFLKDTDSGDELIKEKIIYGKPVKPSKINILVPEQLTAALFCSINKAPERRYAT